MVEFIKPTMNGGYHIQSLKRKLDYAKEIAHEEFLFVP